MAAKTLARVASIRFFARTVDMIVEPAELYVELDVSKAKTVYKDGNTLIVLDDAGLAHVAAHMTEVIGEEVRREQEKIVKKHG